MSSVLSSARRATRSLQKPLEKAVTQSAETPFRTGASSATRQAKVATQKQQQLETVRLAEAEGDVALRRQQALSGKFGRRSLIKSSPAGLSTNLGGTNV